MEARHAEDLQSKLDAQNLDYRRQMCELRDHLQQVSFSTLSLLILHACHRASFMRCNTLSPRNQYVISENDIRNALSFPSFQMLSPTYWDHVSRYQLICHLALVFETWEQERDKMLDNERLAAHARMAEVAERYIVFISNVWQSHRYQIRAMSLNYFI